MGQVILPIGGIRNVLAMSAPLERRVISIDGGQLGGAATECIMVEAGGQAQWLFSVRLFVQTVNPVGGSGLEVYFVTGSNTVDSWDEGIKLEKVLPFVTSAGIGSFIVYETDKVYKWTMQKFYPGGGRAFGCAFRTFGGWTVNPVASFEIAEV